jgi:hypothetical protein
VQIVIEKHIQKINKIMKKEDVKNVLDNLVNSIGKKEIELYKKLIDEKPIENINDYEDLYYMVIYPFKQFVSGLIKTEISENNDVIFILQNSQYIDRHFAKLFINIEGSACSSDKSRTIVRALIHFFKNGEKINFNYEQEYTYHLPKKIFKDHDSILEHYEGLKQLYYGNPEKYLNSILKLKGKTE